MLILICHVFAHSLWPGRRTDSSPQVYPPAIVFVFEQNGSASDRSLTKAVFLDPLGGCFSFNHVAHKTCAAVSSLIPSLRDLQIASALDSFALENSPGVWINIVIVERLAASGPRSLEQALIFICTD